MGIDNNTAKTSFFQKVGNWWNKNGNAVGKGIQVAGTTAMGAGITGMFIDTLNDKSSIFGCGSSKYNMMNPMMYSMMNPMMMGMGGSLFGLGGIGCSCCCPTSMAANTGYQYGFMLGMQQNMINAAQMQQVGLYQYPSVANNPYLQNFNLNNPYSNLIDTTTVTDAETETETDTWDDTKVDFKGTKLKDGEGDSSEGAEYDLKTDALGLKKIKQVKISENDDDESIKKGLIEKGQNVVANLDSDEDGYVSLEEYVKNEKTKSGYDAAVAKRAFSKIDLNNDEKLDWTELAAVNGAFASDPEASSKDNIKPDNVITQKEYNVWSEALGDASNNKIIKRMTAFRKWIVGTSES